MNRHFFAGALRHVSAKIAAPAALAVAIWSLAGCASMTGQSPEPVKPPVIYANMPLDKALKAGIDFGGDTLQDVRKLVHRRKESAKAGSLLRSAIVDGLENSDDHQLMNASALYMSTTEPFPVAMFQKMIGSGRPLAAQLGWQIAAIKPSRAVAAAIDHELTRALAENDEDAIMIPQMANAVAANKMTSAYTFIRRGLMLKGEEEYATAMMSLDPVHASTDFLAYLNLANAEELRQLTLSSVNVYAVIGILKHMQRFPPSMGAQGFEQLFAYAVSRNTALAELAEVVIESYVPRHAELLAEILAKHPAWVQIAYLENVRQRMTPNVGILLGELKKATAESDVVEEIGEIKF